MADRFPRYRPLGVQIGSVPSVDYLSAGAQTARGYEAMSRALDQVSAFAFEKVSQKRKMEWEQAGFERPGAVLEQLAGKPISELSTAERAGLERASLVFGTEIETKARGVIGQIVLEGQSNNLTADQINEQISDAILGFSSSADLLTPEAAYKVRANLGRLREVEYLRSSERDLKRQEGEARAVGMQGLEDISFNIEEAARAGVLNLDEHIANSLESLTSYLEHHSFTPAEIAKQSIDIERRARMAAVRGGYYRNDGLQERTEFFRNFEKGIESGQARVPGLSENDQRALIAEFRTDLSNEKAALAPQVSALNETIRNEIEAVMRNGDMPRPSTIASVNDRINELEKSGVDVSALRSKMDIARSEAGWAQAMKRMPTAQLENIEASLRKQTEEGATGMESARLELVQKRIREQKQQIAKDPVRWGMDTGAIDSGNIFDMSGKTPGEISASFKARVDQVDRFVAANPDASRRYLSDTEADTLKLALDNGSDQQREQVLASINANFGRKAFDVYRQVAKDNPVFAHVGGLSMMGVNRTVINDALKGQRLIDTKAVVREPMHKQTFDNLAGDLLSPFSGAPVAKKGIMETAEAIYIGRGGYETTANPDRMREAFQDAAGRVKKADGEFYGGIAEYNGIKIAIPASIRTEGGNDIESIMERAPIDAFMDAQTGHVIRDPNGEILDIRKLINENKIVLRTVGDGKVTISFKAGGVERLATNGIGGQFVLDLNMLAEKTLMQPVIDVDELEYMSSPTPRAQEYLQEKVVGKYPYSGAGEPSALEKYRQRLRQTGR